ncbi:MAG: nucleotidyltransferase family protein, partial [Chloroflexi bacterium]|nr:nucleotidyltransferase family protein [Chloroflexota bacterium]
MINPSITSQTSAINQLLKMNGEQYRPLLHYLLKRSHPELASSLDKDGKIARLRLRNTARNLLLFKEFEVVHQALVNTGIEVILLKGMAMQSVYPPGLRPFIDIDFLVRKEKLPQVPAVLHKLGFIPSGPDYCNGAEDFMNELIYTKTGRIPIIIEPHWTLGHVLKDETEDLWHHAKRITINNMDTLVLSVDDMLLHSCIHFFMHSKDRLNGWLSSSCDIAELIHQHGAEIEWEKYIARVLEGKLCLPVMKSFQITLALFQPSIPSSVISRLNKCNSTRFERWVYSSSTSILDIEARLTLARFFKMSGALRKWQYFWWILSPPEEYLRGRYGTDSCRFRLCWQFSHLKRIFLLSLRALIRFVFIGS